MQSLIKQSESCNVFYQYFGSSYELKPLSQPFHLEGKGLCTLVRKGLPFKVKDLGWGIHFANTYISNILIISKLNISKCNKIWKLAFFSLKLIVILIEF
jgi:hypothetical protein